MTPRFSVIIPVYNRAHLVLPTIATVFSQTRRDFEIIVVDDGSTDDSLGALAEFKDRMTVVTQANMGPGPARNHGAQLAKGEYLCFLDSDDLWFPWTLDTYAAVIDATSSPSFIAGAPRVFTDEGELTTAVRAPLRSETFPDLIASSDAWRWFSASSFVIRRDAFLRVGGFAPSRISGEDAELVLRLGDAPGFVHILEPVTFGYREHEANLTQRLGPRLEGLLFSIQAERAGAYPGGVRRSRGRREMILRACRPFTLEAARRGELWMAWKAYLATVPWNAREGRFKYLFGLPVLMAARALGLAGRRKH